MSVDNDTLKYRRRLYLLLEKYEPDKVGGAMGLAQKAAGREEPFMKALVKKYGPEPPYVPLPPDYIERLTKLLTDFYTLHDQSKISNIPNLIQNHAGAEEGVFRVMEKNYGVTVDRNVIYSPSAATPAAPATAAPIGKAPIKVPASAPPQSSGHPTERTVSGKQQVPTPSSGKAVVGKRPVPPTTEAAVASGKSSPRSASPVPPSHPVRPDSPTPGSKKAVVRVSSPIQKPAPVGHSPPLSKTTSKSHEMESTHPPSSTAATAIAAPSNGGDASPHKKVEIRLPDGAPDGSGGGATKTMSSRRHRDDPSPKEDGRASRSSSGVAGWTHSERKSKSEKKEKHDKRDSAQASRSNSGVTGDHTEEKKSRRRHRDGDDTTSHDSGHNASRTASAAVSRSKSGKSKHHERTEDEERLKKEKHEKKEEKRTEKKKKEKKGGWDGFEDLDELQQKSHMRERLRAFYARYDEAKIPSIDGIVEKYYKHPTKLFMVLEKKYGPEFEEDGESDNENEANAALTPTNARKVDSPAVSPRNASSGAKPSLPIVPATFTTPSTSKSTTSKAVGKSDRFNYGPRDKRRQNHQMEVVCDPPLHRGANERVPWTSQAAHCDGETARSSRGKPRAHHRGTASPGLIVVVPDEKAPLPPTNATICAVVNAAKQFCSKGSTGTSRSTRTKRALDIIVDVVGWMSLASPGRVADLIQHKYGSRLSEAIQMFSPSPTSARRGSAHQTRSFFDDDSASTTQLDNELDEFLDEEEEDAVFELQGRIGAFLTRFDPGLATLSLPLGKAFSSTPDDILGALENRYAADIANLRALEMAEDQFRHRVKKFLNYHHPRHQYDITLIRDLFSDKQAVLMKYLEREYGPEPTHSYPNPPTKTHAAGRRKRLQLVPPHSSKEGQVAETVHTLRILKLLQDYSLDDGRFSTAPHSPTKPKAGVTPVSRVAAALSLRPMSWLLALKSAVANDNARNSDSHPSMSTGDVMSGVLSQLLDDYDTAHRVFQFFNYNIGVAMEYLTYALGPEMFQSPLDEAYDAVLTETRVVLRQEEILARQQQQQNQLKNTKVGSGLHMGHCDPSPVSSRDEHVVLRELFERHGFVSSDPVFVLESNGLSRFAYLVIELYMDGDSTHMDDLMGEDFEDFGIPREILAVGGFEEEQRGKPLHVASNGMVISGRLSPLVHLSPKATPSSHPANDATDPLSPSRFNLTTPLHKSSNIAAMDIQVIRNFFIERGLTHRTGDSANILRDHGGSVDATLAFLNDLYPASNGGTLSGGGGNTLPLQTAATYLSPTHAMGAAARRQPSYNNTSRSGGAFNSSIGNMGGLLSQHASLLYLAPLRKAVAAQINEEEETIRTVIVHEEYLAASSLRLQARQEASLYQRLKFVSSTVLVGGTLREGDFFTV